MQLQLDDVAAGYGRRPVITGLSLALEAGAFVTMLGPNGAGKTTTARVIAGLLPARQGRIAFEGHDITRITPDARVARGIAPQLRRGARQADGARLQDETKARDFQRDARVLLDEEHRSAARVDARDRADDLLDEPGSQPQ